MSSRMAIARASVPTSPAGPLHKAASLAEAYIPGIDGLRAVAVLSVMIFHINSAWLPGGFTGVDIFFVISGYVISKSLAVHDHSCFGPYIRQFYKRRALRILPALLVFLFIASIVSTMLIPQAWLSASNEGTAFSAFLGLSNFFLVSSSDGYFSDRVDFNPFVHTWSLAVEEQFYLFFPLLFFFWTFPARADDRWRIVKLATLPVLVLFSLIVSFYETPFAPQRAFYLLPSRFWELGAGALLFVVQAKGVLDLSETARSWSFSLGLLLLVVSFASADSASFPFPWALAPVVGTVLMIASLRQDPAHGKLQHLLEVAWVRHIGAISYSLYLWHWAIFAIFRWTIGMGGVAQVLLASILAFALASLSYRLIETPFRQWPVVKRASSGFVVTLAALLLGVSLFIESKLFSIGSQRLNLSVTADSCTWRPGFNSKCHDSVPATGGSSGEPHKIIVAGDSHAWAYSTMIQLAARELGMEMVTFTRSGCSVLNLMKPTSPDSLCGRFYASLNDNIAKIAKPGDILFLPSLRVPRISDQWGMFDGAELGAWAEAAAASPAQRDALAEARRMVTEFQGMGLTVVFDAPKPVFAAPAFRCSDWFNRTNPVCAPGFEVSLTSVLKHREPTMKQLRALKDSNGIVVWDALPLLCPEAECRVFDGDKPLFQDADHLSGYGNTLLAPAFVELLTGLLAIEPAAAADGGDRAPARQVETTVGASDRHSAR